MLEEVCAYLHNYFHIDPVTDKPLIYPGKYTIENGSITLPFLAPGQYFRVIGSKMNDGIHLYGQDELTDETFNGVIWGMRVPKRVLDIVDEITAWKDKYGDIVKTPYSSEDMIGVYRYSKAVSSSASGKVTVDYISSWQKVFQNELNPWRKL